MATLARPTGNTKTRRTDASGFRTGGRIASSINGRSGAVARGSGAVPPRAAGTVAPSGTNNDLVFTAREPGVGGNAIRVRIVVSGNNTALSVSVSGNDITINSATNGSAVATSTAAQVKTAVEGSAPATALVSVAHASGNDGTGTVAAVGYVTLAGGTNYVAGR